MQKKQQKTYRYTFFKFKSNYPLVQDYFGVNPAENYDDDSTADEIHNYLSDKFTEEQS